MSIGESSLRKHHDVEGFSTNSFGYEAGATFVVPDEARKAMVRFNTAILVSMLTAVRGNGKILHLVMFLRSYFDIVDLEV